jgi:hypothetical protein
VIDGGPRTATIASESAVSALELTQQALLRLLEREPGVARAMYDELQRHLFDPQPLPSEDVPVTREMLVDLCTQLRRIDRPDFANLPPSKRRWLGLSGLFARAGERPGPVVRFGRAPQTRTTGMSTRCSATNHT